MRRHWVVLFAISAVAASMIVAAPAAAAASNGSNTRGIAAAGVTSLDAGGLGTDSIQSPEIFPQASDTGAAADGTASAPTLPVNRSETGDKSGNGEHSGSSNQDGSNPTQVLSFDGLNHRAQRLANNGNQFSVEPPDQGLCAGNGFVLETINDVMAVYNSTGSMLKGPVDLNTFYGYAPAIVRATATTPAVFGPFVTDPSCYFDPATQRWFHVVLTLETFSATGNFQGPNHLDIAVSQTSSPLGAWTIYRLPVQDDGTAGTPNHGCTIGPARQPPTNPNACIGDYPHIGADANGFYITTNEYAFFGPEFKAAQIYAFSKRSLAANAATVLVTQIDTTNAVRGNQAGFTVWPAEAPNGNLDTTGDRASTQGENGRFDNSRGGIEYFMSSNAASEVNAHPNLGSRDLIVWALGNTRSLDSAIRDLSLSNAVVRVGRYTPPPKSNQKAGNTPLADCVNNTTLQVTATLQGCWRLLVAKEPAHNEVESVIDSNDTRMQQVMYSGGMLYGALDTALIVNGKAEAGIEWFATRPQVSGHGVRARLVNQGYVGSADTNLTYPALGVNENGDGVLGFSLLGTNNYPSAAYAPFHTKSGVGAIHIVAAGLGPDDGFTSYKAFVPAPPRTRWGDYGAAVIDGSNIWIASEYIGQTCTFAQWLSGSVGSCGGTRTALGNWDTRITELSIERGD